MFTAGLVILPSTLLVLVKLPRRCGFVADDQATNMEGGLTRRPIARPR